MKVLKLKVLLLGGLLFIIGCSVYFDFSQYVSLEFVKSQQNSFNSFYDQKPVMVLVVYFLCYVIVAALSLPGAAVMTLMGGALFGLLVGTVLVSFASTIGATVAFLIARFIGRDFLRSHYSDVVATIDVGIEKEGAFYLFTLRLMPIFPFFLINALMGLTTMRVVTFFWVSQLGMLLGTIVYVFAGTELAKIDALTDILSLNILIAFTLIGIFPLVAKRGITWYRSDRCLRAFPKPKRFDYNMVVIGAGAAGLVSAYIASAVKAKVALIEKHKMGGDCLNTGCVPSKALIRSTRMLSHAHRAKEYGFKHYAIDFDFADIMQRVRDVIKKIEPHDSVERYKKLGVDCIAGEATIVDPYHVCVNEKRISTKNIVIATGARPLVPPIPGLDLVNYLTSDTIWNLECLPKQLVVLGGGAIGCELAQCFARLGTHVTLVEVASQLLGREDKDVASHVAKSFADDNITVLLLHEAKEVIIEKGKSFLIVEHKYKKTKLYFDQILLALGRKANIEGFGLERLGVEIATSGMVAHDSYLRTNYSNIFVCGDVAGPYQFTHVASHQAWYAAVNSLFGLVKKFKVDYRVIPWAIFTDPEIARVGLNEKEAKERNIAYEITYYDTSNLDRAIIDGEDKGMVKVLTVPGKDKILGATIVGSHAGDLIAEFVLAMKQGIGLNKLLGTTHIYPTLAEMNKYVAGNWKKRNTSAPLLMWLERFHRLRRGG